MNLLNVSLMDLMNAFIVINGFAECFYCSGLLNAIYVMNFLKA